MHAWWQQYMTLGNKVEVEEYHIWRHTKYGKWYLGSKFVSFIKACIGGQILFFKNIQVKKRAETQIGGNGRTCHVIWREDRFQELLTI